MVILKGINSMTIRFSKFIFTLILFVFSFTPSFADDSYTVTKVIDGIFYHQGVNEDANEDNIGAIANVGFIVGSRCVAVVDSGGSYREGIYLRREIRKHTVLPICYVINTHVHPDHLLGNAAFKDDNPTFIGNEKLPAAIAARKDFYITTFKEILGNAFTGSEFIIPTTLVHQGQPKKLDLGGRILTLKAYPTSHTDNDLTVLDNQTKTLWTGDLLFINRIPALDGSINGWLNSMHELNKMDLDFVIPGHGPAIHDNWQQALAKQIQYFSTLRKGVRHIINDMGTIDQATKKVGLNEKNKWLLFDNYHRRNITAAFTELEWE
jgi:quinoprotein relay system zinc metallohydrolase 2